MPALYVFVGLGVLTFALPRLPAMSSHASGVFTMAWILFAFVVIGANLWGAVGADAEAGRARTVKARVRMRQDDHGNSSEASGEKRLMRKV